MRNLLVLFLLIPFICLGQNAVLKNRYTTNSDSATVHGDHLDQLNASALATGTAPASRLGSGTATAATALFGDNSWKIISGTGNLIAEGTNGITAVTNGQLVTISFNGLNIVISNASFLGPFTGSGTAAGKVTLNSGTGTGGFFDYSGATHSNDLVAVDSAGRFVYGSSLGFTVWTNDGTGNIWPLIDPSTNHVLVGSKDWLGVGYQNLFQVEATNNSSFPANSAIFVMSGTPPVGANPSGSTAVWGINTRPTISAGSLYYQSGGGAVQGTSPSGTGNTNASIAVNGYASGTTSSSVGAGIKVGVLGESDPFDAGSTNVGVVGNVLTDAAGTLVGGFFEISDGGSDPLIEPAVLLLDHRFGTNNLITARTNNGTKVFSVSGSGLVTANGFTDNSGTAGSLVAYQGGNRLGATNVNVLVSNVTFTTINVSNLNVYDSLTVNSNVTIKGKVTVNNITITNGLTNLNLTANTVLKADGGQQISSIGNASGALTNNGSGTVGWDNTKANTDANNSFTGNNVFTKTNYFTLNVTTSTNQNQITPDFSVAEQLMSTNAAFTFLAPVGVDSGKVEAQWTLCHITNTTASAVLITSPANCHTVGTAYVTNLTDVWFNCYANKFTNAFYVPIF